MEDKLKLLDQVREKLRVKHYSIRTEQAYVDWIKRFVLFHRKRHPETMGNREVSEFISHLATHRNVAVSTQSAERAGVPLSTGAGQGARVAR